MIPFNQPQNAADLPTDRDTSGRFTGGNKITRAGSKNRVSKDALSAVQSLASLAIANLRVRIEAGDMAAIRLCLEYTLPRGGRTIDLDTANPNAWADAMAEGEISVDEAARAAQALGKLAGVAEIQELQTRLDELETSIGERQK